MKNHDNFPKDNMPPPLIKPNLILLFVSRTTELNRRHRLTASIRMASQTRGVSLPVEAAQQLHACKRRLHWADAPKDLVAADGHVTEGMAFDLDGRGIHPNAGATG